MGPAGFYLPLTFFVSFLVLFLLILSSFVLFYCELTLVPLANVFQNCLKISKKFLSKAVGIFSSASKVQILNFLPFSSLLTFSVAVSLGKMFQVFSLFVQMSELMIRTDKFQSEIPWSKSNVARFLNQKPLAVPWSARAPLRHLSLLFQTYFWFFSSLSARQSFPKRRLRLSNQKLMPWAVFSGSEGVRCVPGLARAQGHFDGSRRLRG